MNMLTFDRFIIKFLNMMPAICLDPSSRFSSASSLVSVANHFLYKNE
jgi:hypothetical protein